MADGKQKERTTVTIYGQEYTIVGYEKPGHVIEVAKYVDSKMREIKSMNPYLDTTRLAVLTAINVVNDYLKLKEKLERIEKENKEKEDENGHA